MNGDTKLSEALKASPAILEYVISLNPHDFARLRNPLLNKVMPTRISLKRLATMVGMAESEFVDKINELAGLASDTESKNATAESSPPVSPIESPDWMTDVDVSQIASVDVTPIDAQLGDPMPPINIAVNTCNPGDVIGIKHMWEPQPLYDIWQARGFKFWAQQINQDLWHVFVFKPRA